MLNINDFITDSTVTNEEYEAISMEELAKQGFTEFFPYKTGLGLVLSNPKTGKSLRINYSHGAVKDLQEKETTVAQLVATGEVRKTFTNQDPNKPRLTLSKKAGGQNLLETIEQGRAQASSVPLHTEKPAGVPF